VSGVSVGKSYQGVLPASTSNTMNAGTTVTRNYITGKRCMDRQDKSVRQYTLWQ
jgi:hypothetical protein